MLGLTPVEIMFWGSQIIAVGLVAYLVFEWGSHLMHQMRNGAALYSKSSNKFAVATLALSLTPLIISVVILRSQPIGGTRLFGEQDTAAMISLLTMSLICGAVLQGAAYAIFAMIAKRSGLTANKAAK
jgi:hypothetical protein